MHGNNAANFVENDVLTLDLLNIPRKRNSLDPIRNRYGNKILDFCKGNNLFIVNGRIGEDRMTGKLTCKNASIVDYCISSTSLLKYFRNFSVLDFSHFYSDVHCALAISLSGLSLKNVEETGENRNRQIFSEKIKKWDNEKCHEFKDQIEQGKVEELKILLDDVESGHLDFSKKYSSVDKTKINTLLDHLCSIFCKSAKSTFGTCKFSNSKKKGKKKLGKLKKEWFNDDCHFERQNFRKRKRKFKTYRTDQNFQDLKQAEKRYKKVMDQAILDHKRKLSKKI